MNKIKTFVNNKIRLILFCIIFILICLIYNFNNQELNFFFKRGIVLEYSLDKNTNIDKLSLEKKLLESGFNYTFIENSKNLNSTIYDSDNKPILNMLHIALPIKMDKNKVESVNQVSNYIFENYPNSKLLNIKTLNENYHKPFNSILKFLGIFLTSLFFYTLILFLKDKDYFKTTKKSIVDFLNKQKKDFCDFLSETKKRGVGYFLKRILFDEVKDEQGVTTEPNVTKEIISTIIFVLIAVILIRFIIGELRWIPSGSMRPTILEKDRVFVEKLNFPKKEIKRGDILVFYPPEAQLKNDFISIFSRLSGIACKDIAFIKRAIGMPNDKFEIKFDTKTGQSRVYINDIALNEPYINSRLNWTKCTDNMYCGPFIIPEGHYFMMGDNRGNSQDSRFWGFLKEDRIIGRANFMFWPISRINIMNDKYFELHKQKNDGKFENQKYILNRYEFLYKI